MFENSISGTSAMMSLYKEGLLDKDYASVKVLGLYVLPPYPIFTTGKKIQSVKDFRGLRMRTPSTTVGVALAKLGAVPLGIPLNMIGDTIASGYVDAIAYGWDFDDDDQGRGRQVSRRSAQGRDRRAAGRAGADDRHEPRRRGIRCPPISGRSSKNTLPIIAMGSARIREAQEAVTKKKLQSDPRFTALILQRRAARRAAARYRAGSGGMESQHGEARH